MCIWVLGFHEEMCLYGILCYMIPANILSIHLWKYWCGDWDILISSQRKAFKWYWRYPSPLNSILNDMSSLTNSCNLAVLYWTFYPCEHIHMAVGHPGLGAVGGSLVLQHTNMYWSAQWMTKARSLDHTITHTRNHYALAYKSLCKLVSEHSPAWQMPGKQTYYFQILPYS